MLRRLQFDFWYLFHPPWDTRVSPPELLEFIGRHPPGRAIDLGCGSGTNVIALAQRGWRVTGLDFAPRAIRIAKHRIRAAGVSASLYVGDVTRLDKNAGPFDLALDLGCFHGVQQRDAYLAGLDRVLAPGGHWLLYGFFRTPAGAAGPGLDDNALLLIRSRGFRIRSRADGIDRRGRPSVWLLCQHESGTADE